jgi:hypothetical protein
MIVVGEYYVWRSHTLNRYNPPACPAFNSYYLLILALIFFTSSSKSTEKDFRLVLIFLAVQMGGRSWTRSKQGYV